MWWSELSEDKLRSTFKKGEEFSRVPSCHVAACE